MIEFKIYSGKYDIFKEKDLLQQMRTVAYQYDYVRKEAVLQYLDEESKICCMFKGGKLIGFSWLGFKEEEQIAELHWLISSKTAKFNESKMLLDKTLEFCKRHNAKSVRFNCADEAWRRIKDKESLFKKFGYNITENEISVNEADYEISIEI